MLRKATRFEDAYANFTWEIPERYNIGADVCDKWAETHPNNIAIIDVESTGQDRKYSFSDLKKASNRLANALRARGISDNGEAVGDRVGILLPQCAETAISHIAVFKLGAVSIPLFTLFGEEALRHRLKDSGAKALITNAAGVRLLEKIKTDLPQLECVISIDETERSAEHFDAICGAQSNDFDVVDTAADDPALIIYTSGTTGDPKGALHAHRVLLGHLPGVELSHNFLPQEGDVIWTPADWAWIGGLLDVLLPGLHHGIPVVAKRFEKFSPQAAFELIEHYKIKNAFLPPTALKLMRQSTQPNELSLRSVGSGGETLGSELLEWGQDTFGTTINEFYGQTECNMIVSSCSELEAPIPGVMGRAVPGHDVDIINLETGDRTADLKEGSIAVKSPNPVMFLEYWGNPKATREKFVDGSDGPWLITGDRGRRHPDGRLEFIGRDDDIISSAGYRIGPAEIENCLLRHKAVQMAGVVGLPDEVRGQIVAAFVKLNPGFDPSDALADEIADHVRQRLAAYEYPRIIRFLNDLPMTTTGKIIRKALRDLSVEEASTQDGADSD